MRRHVTVLVVTLLVAAACGDDGGSAGGAGGDFCGFIRALDEDTSFDFDSPTPQQLEAAYTEAKDQVEAAARMAPGEIRADVELLASGLLDFIDVLEENDWRFETVFLDDPRIAALDSAEFDAADRRVDEFCGISSDPVDDLEDFDLEPADPDDFEGLDPADFEDLDSESVEDIMVQSWMIMGHDRETAECLARELGDIAGSEDFDFGAEVCGMTMLEAVTGGG